MGLLGPITGRLPWARGLGPFGRWGPPDWHWMWRRWGSGANSSIISAWGRSRGIRNCGSNDCCSSGWNGGSTLANDSGSSGWMLNNGGGGNIRAGV